MFFLFDFADHSKHLKIIMRALAASFLQNQPPECSWHSVKLQIPQTKNGTRKKRITGKTLLIPIFINNSLCKSPSPPGNWEQIIRHCFWQKHRPNCFDICFCHQIFCKCLNPVIYWGHLKINLGDLLFFGLQKIIYLAHSLRAEELLAGYLFACQMYRSMKVSKPYPDAKLRNW